MSARDGSTTDAFGIEIEPQVMQDLVEAGFLAASRNMAPLALDVFAAVIAARPGLAAGYVGTAYALLGAGMPEKAVEALRDAPPGMEIDLFRGMASLRAGRIEAGRKLLEHVAKYADQDNLRDIAKTLLAEGTS
jgi:hypothetical protein